MYTDERHGTSQHIDKTLSRARLSILERYRVVAVRPDGVIVSKRVFGGLRRVYFGTDSITGAP